MGYRSLIEKSVGKAFDLMGDLADSVQLVAKSDVAFNFGTMSTVEDAVQETYTVKAYVGEAARYSGKDTKRYVKREVTIDSNAITSLEAYDEVVYDSLTWKIAPEYTDDGFLKIFTIVRGDA